MEIEIEIESARIFYLVVSSLSRIGKFLIFEVVNFSDAEGNLTPDLVIVSHELRFFLDSPDFK